MNKRRLGFTAMSSSLTCARLTVFATAAVIIQMIGLSLFVFGFFPVKPALSGVSGPESFRPPMCSSDENQSERMLPPDKLRSLYKELSGIPPSFDRLILMVIDGLPAEFVLGKDDQPPSKALREAMPYTQSLLANGMAIGYHAKAAPPTVTMPRLKAMVSGAVGGFLDVAFNFNTQALLDDNLLDQFFRIAWKMVMLGDETWLKLFPRVFERHDGVSSFYVKDTVHVDHNVSRHLENELSRNDWSLMILHYLGLDHVGHIGGRNSVLMVPKLMEMDEVVKRIHLNTVMKENDLRTLLVVVSDHGMTDNGNHGGSSYEETDSLALFIGLRNHVSDYASATQNTANQVDIAPTLSLLFGVPIPKNNIGVLVPETLDFLTDNQKLRALEVNSWQLLRLLQAQLPGLSCGNFLCDGVSDDQRFSTSDCYGSTEKVLCCLYLNAAVSHSSWKSKKVSGFSSREDYDITAAAYYKFLNTASEWLSHQVTDKPINQLAAGVAAMILSCVILLYLILRMCKDIHLQENKQHFGENDGVYRWHLDETFVLGVILILFISMGSSSMIEEEQYIWHFVTTTLYLLLLRKTLQSLQVGRAQSSLNSFQGLKKRKELLICSISVLLVSGRILRGWHQGGVNWTFLPDISKWLEEVGSRQLKFVQLASGLLVISLSFFALFIIRLKAKIVLLVGFSFLISGSLILHHITSYQENMFASSSYGATLLAQTIYAVLSISTIGAAISLPWLMPHSTSLSSAAPVDVRNKSPVVELKDSLYVIGWAYIFCWCLLQMLLQQPVNSVPVLLLLVQILAFMVYSSYSGPNHKQWIEVAALYYLGMAGHFALGNTNTLATIDVAGAFIGISSHSTFLSGVLMFIITFASPMLFLLSMVMHISVKDTTSSIMIEKADSGHLLKMMLGFPCLVPLGLSSMLLTAYTIVLLLMRNHLFVWSVFSPKYLYACATTVCVYIGVSVVAATGFYTYKVLSFRRKNRKDYKQ